jgi:hypothetical protein
MGQRQPGYRYTVGRATDIVHTRAVAELHALGFAAMFAADTEETAIGEYSVFVDARIRKEL